MNSLIARTLCAFIFIISIQFSAKAQDSLATKKDTNKVVVIVTPGQKYKKPVRKYAAPTTAERSGAVYGDTAASKPIRTTTTGDHAAPTTAERTGYPTYMDPNYQKPHTRSNVAVGVNGISSAPVTTQPVASGGGTTSSSSSSTLSTTGTSNITTTTTTTTTTLPDGKKIISVSKKSDTTHTNKTDTAKTDTIKADTVKQDSGARSMKMAFVEVGGPGLAISFNYDARFNGERKGFGYRVGAGYFSDGHGNTVFTVPMQINYLLTKDENNFIELGGGTTFLNSTGSNKGPTFIFDKVTGFIGTATIGYRYQPADHNLNFRIDFVPIFYDEGVIWAGGVSVGYNFK